MFEQIHTCHLSTHFLCLYWWIQLTLVRSMMIASVGGTHILFPVIFFPINYLCSIETVFGVLNNFRYLKYMR